MKTGKTFRGVIGAVIGMAAVATGYFIKPRLALVMLLVVGAIAGWLAGRSGTFRKLWRGLLYLLAAALVLAVCVFCFPDLLLAEIPTGDLAPFLPQLMMTTVPVWVLLLIFAVALMAAFMVFLCVFNAAALFVRWYFTAAAILILLIEAMYLSTWLYSAIDAAFCALDTPSTSATLTVAVLLLVLPAVWAVFNIRAAKRRNWHNFAWCAGSFAAIALLAWGFAAAAVGIWSARAVADTAAVADPRGELPGEVKKREQELARACAIAPLEARGIELPGCGVKNWRAAYGDQLPEETKRRTQEFAASDEGKAFFDRNTELIDLYCRIFAEGKFDVEDSTAYLKGCREAAYRCVAQAALAHYRGDPAAVLPALEPVEKLEQTLYDREQTIIEGLVRFALTSIRIDTAVQCGPDAPEYAAHYRAMLKRFLDRETKIPAETGFIRAELERVRRFENGKYTYRKGTGFYPRLVHYPRVCAALIRALKQAEAGEKSAPEWRRNGAVPESVESGYGRAMRKALECRALYSTALALKIYRCEKGEYPETLNALVPGILEKTPRGPFGEKVFYQRLPDGAFELTVDNAKLTSRPDY